MAENGQKKPWYINKGCLLVTMGLFIVLTIYVLLTPVVLFVATFYSRFWKLKGLKDLQAKGKGAFWLTASEKKDFAELDKLIAEKIPAAAPAAQSTASTDTAETTIPPAAGPQPAGDGALAEAKQRYQRLCALPLKRRARFVRHYGAAYGAPAGLIAWLIAVVLYSFEFNKGIFEGFAFYFHFPVRILTRTMLEGELVFVLSMSTTALAVALIAGLIAGFMGSRLAPKAEYVTRENYLRYGDSSE